MADFVFSRALGRHVHYASLPGTSDGLVAILLESSGIDDDDTLRAYDTVEALLAGGSTEQTTMGRKTLANVTVTVDDDSNEASWTADNLTYTAASGNAVGKLVVAYDPDTGTGTGDDGDLIPLTAHDLDLTPDGNSVEIQVDSDGVAVAEPQAT